MRARVDTRRGSGAIGLDGGEDEGRQRRDRQAHAKRSNKMGEGDVRPIGRVRPDSVRHGVSQGDDSAAGEQWQAPAEPATEHAGERRDDRNQHLQGNEG